VVSTTPAETHHEPRIRLTREARHALLLEAARDIVLEEGARGVTMEGVALRAGASKTLAYAYFTDADAIRQELYDGEAAVLCKRVIEAMSSQHGLDQRLRAAIHAYFEFITTAGQVLVALARYDTNIARPELQHRDIELVKALAQVLADEAGCTPARAQSLAVVVMTVADTHGRMALLGVAPRQHLEQQAIAFALGGIERAIG
jgi:AcrR family transcriptional regulator